MQIKFKGSKTDLQKALDQFGLKAQKIKVIKKGVVNSSFLILISNGKKYVLRVYQKGHRTDAQIQNELKIMKDFSLNNIPIVRVLKNKSGGYLTKFFDAKGEVWRAILMKYVKGKHLEASQINLIPVFAKYQAKMHVVASGFRKTKNNFFGKTVSWLENESKQALRNIENAKLRRIYALISSDILAEAKERIKEINALPSGEVHLDYDSDNLIVSKKRIKAILDFDDASSQPFVLDTANSLWWWLFLNSVNMHATILDAYLKSYTKYRVLSKKERDLLLFFIRMRNVTLAATLFVNMKEKRDLKSFGKALKADKLFKEIKL